MKQNNRRALSLQRTTLRNLTTTEMSGVDGGTVIIIRTRVCPIPTTTLTTTRPSAIDGCPSALACPTTTILTDPTTSVINPGGGL